MKLLTTAVLCFLSGFAVGVLLPESKTSPIVQLRYEPFSAGIQEAVATDGPYRNDETENFSTSNGKLIVALRQAGLLRPEPSSVNLINAWALLNELSQRDRKNAAYLYLRLAVEVLAGHELSQLEKTGYQILKAQYYKNPFTDLHRTFLRNHIGGNRTAGVVLKELPQIDYVKIFTATNEYLANTQSVRKHLAQLLSGPSYLDDVGAAYVSRNAAEHSLSASMKLNACPSEKILRVSYFEKAQRKPRFVTRGF